MNYLYNLECQLEDINFLHERQKRVVTELELQVDDDSDNSLKQQLAIEQAKLKKLLDQHTELTQEYAEAINL